jgi:CBS domain-containing protein
MRPGEIAVPERPVRSILRRRPGPALVTAGPGETVRAAAECMSENCCGSILVVEGEEHLLGIFTERDLLVRVVAAGLDPAETELCEVMTRDVETIGAEEPVREAVRRMDEGGFRHLPVAYGGRVVGVLSLRDIPVLELGRMAEELDRRHRLAERIW